MKVVLYPLVTGKSGRNRYVRVKGRKLPEGKHGWHYLRDRENAKRKWEGVGHDLAVAEQEQKARRESLNTAQRPIMIAKRETVGAAVNTFLADQPDALRYILGVFRDCYGWGRDPASFPRTDFKAYAAHLEKVRPARKECWSPHTRKNYLNHLTTFLRSTGRIVIAARNEQDATIKRATAVIPNTLVLARADFLR